MSKIPRRRATALGFVGIAVAASVSLGVSPAAFANGTLDGISYVEPEVASGASFTLHPTGSSDPPTLKGCIRNVDDGVAGSSTLFTSAMPFGDVTDTFFNAGPNSWSRTTEIDRGTFSDCDALPAADYTATVTVLPAASIDEALAAQELVSGTDATSATVSLDYFDPSAGMGWALDDSGACDDTGDMPSGLSIDTSWSDNNVVPPVSISGTPAEGTQGTHTVCLALVDDNGARGFAILTIDIAAPATLADTGADALGIPAGLIIAGSLVAAGILFVFRRHIAQA